MTEFLPHPVRDRLIARGITEIIIIDDAFDPPNRDSLGPIPIGQFWTDVKDNDDAIAELKALGLECAEPFDIADAQVTVLFKNLATLTATKEACSQLFSTILGKRAQIDRFSKPIEEILKIKVVPLGESDEFVHSRARLILLDYFLGTQNPKEAMEAAVRKARDIYKVYPAGGEKPLIVLMSSVLDVASHKEEFRKQSNLLGGMFDFVPKDDLGNTDKLFLRLGTWATGLVEGYKIQHFVETLEGSARKAIDSFIDNVKSLSIEDYGHIQRLSLQEDGHPLGDYMLWLLGAHFGNLLFNEDKELRTQQKQLDSLWINSAPPCQQAPSVTLADMYSTALFDSSVADLGPHPLSQAEPATELDEPLVRLGDLFMRAASNQVLLVISPACDLTFSPRGERVFDPDRSVMLIPGRVQPLREAVPPGEDLRTELFVTGGVAYRILWNKKQVKSVPLGLIAKCLRRFKYEPKARLRLPFALQLQQSFAADLTRVGMPAAPPIYQPVSIRAYQEGNDGKHALLHGAKDDAAFLALGRKGTYLVLTVGYVLWLQERFEILAGEYETRKAGLPADKASEGSRLAQRIKELRASKVDYDLLLRLLEPKLLKGLTKKTEIEKKLLTVVPDGDFSGLYDVRGAVITLVFHELLAEEEGQ